jgi:hypothetical protein
MNLVLSNSICDTELVVLVSFKIAIKMESTHLLSAIVVITVDVFLSVFIHLCLLPLCARAAHPQDPPHPGVSATE